MTVGHGKHLGRLPHDSPASVEKGHSGIDSGLARHSGQRRLWRFYAKWVGLRQTCLAHLIRHAKGLAERKGPEIVKCGVWAHKELQRLCQWPKRRPQSANGTCSTRVSFAWCSSAATGQTTPANCPVASSTKWIICSCFSRKPVLLRRTITPNASCASPCCGEKSALAPSAKGRTFCGTNSVPAPDPPTSGQEDISGSRRRNGCLLRWYQPRNRLDSRGQKLTLRAVTFSQSLFDLGIKGSTIAQKASDTSHDFILMFLFPLEKRI